MSGRNAYLECLPREKAVTLWQSELKARGYFDSGKLPVQTIAVTDSLGRVSAACIYAKQSVPHYNGSAMDGIAVRFGDTFGAGENTPVKLKVLAKEEKFVPGGCYIVDTGDAMPGETNAVIMIEDAHIKEGEAEIIAAAAPWQHVRVIGEDIVKGEMLLPEHHLIKPADIAALLAAGLTEVPVVSKVKVAVIPTGTEIVETVQELTPGTILDVNSHMICAALQEWGASPVRQKIVPDDEFLIKEKVAASLQECDMVIVIAGTSAGTEDYTSKILGQLGEVLVHGVSIRPGKPVILSICAGKPVIGLPGYPVSAMLTAELFIKDVVLARGKLPAKKTERLKAVLAKQIPSQVGMEEYVRVSLGTIKDKKMAVPLGRGAGIISSLTKAQGILKIEEGLSGLGAQEEVWIDLLAAQEVGQTLLAIGSHDLALDILGVFLRRETNFTLSCANVGSMGGILAAKNNEAHLAGIHMLDSDTGEYNLPFVRKYFSKTPYQLVHLAKREQGLMVPGGNPKKISGLADLNRPGLIYINRQRGSGTRMLLDYLLPKHNIAPEKLEGYEKEVSTHMAVAATIAAGAADTGLGIRAAAAALSLEFISVAEESYDLILNLTPGEPLQKIIIGILESPAFRQEVERLGGYDLTMSGKILAEQF